jgi:hypothetical protein
MPKRTFWLTTGVAIGAGSTLWAERKVRRSVQQAAARLQPDAVVVEVGRSARQVAGTAGDRVRDAVSSGRDEMQRREEELWAELAVQGVEQTPLAGHPVAAVTPLAQQAGPNVPAALVGPLESQSSRAGRRTRRLRAKSPSHLDK